MQDQAETAPEAQAGQNEVTFSMSPGLEQRLGALDLSVTFSSYQSGLLYLVGRQVNGGVNIHQMATPKPMGLCLAPTGDLWLSGQNDVTRFANALEPGEVANQSFDACYVARTVHVTGSLDAHDVGVNAEGEPIFVNTRFNCLARPSARFSFEEVWRPPFVSALVDEDRCHLNGLAMQEGEARYVTAVSRSDTIDGWRDRRGDGGVIIDVQSGEVVCEGLSMPHSPRLHNGELWVLNSGTGELGVVNLEGPLDQRFEPRVFCPGFLRGLRFIGDMAFVGLSKPRYQRFEGLTLDQRLRDADSEPWCGIQVLDLRKGSCVDWLRLDGAVSELYDLELLPGVFCPMAIPQNAPEIANFIKVRKPVDVAS